MLYVNDMVHQNWLPSPWMHDSWSPLVLVVEKEDTRWMCRSMIGEIATWTCSNIIALKSLLVALWPPPIVM